MRYWIFIYLISFALNNQTIAQWFFQNAVHQRFTIISMKFVNNNIGYAVGDKGTIIKTTNGGDDWSNQNSGTEKLLCSVDFIDENNGFAISPDGTILKTNDGGTNWSKYSLGSSLRDIDYVNQNLAYAVGLSIYKTTNAGLNWTTIYYGDFYSLCFLNENLGFIAGRGYILKTTNGGQTWNHITVQTDIFLSDVFFINDNIGWCVGEGGRIFKTVNGGLTWALQNSNTEKMLNSIKFINESIGWAVGVTGITDLTVSKTTDGGETWFNQPCNIVNIISTIEILNDSTALVAGYGGYIFKTTDGGSIWFNPLSVSNASLSSVYFVNENLGWAVGGVHVLKTTDGGNNWILIAILGNELNLQDVYFKNSDTGWVTGRYYYSAIGPIYKTTNGGLSWTEENNSFGGNDIYFVDGMNGWMVGGGYPSGIIKTTDGGLTWNHCGDFSHNYFYAVHFIDNYTGWVVGEWGRIIKTTDGGNSWIEQLSAGNQLRSVFAIDEQNIWVVGENIIINSTNGGYTWENKFLQDNAGYQSVQFLNNNIGWITGGGMVGSIFNTIDGGSNWECQFERIGNALNIWYASCFFVNENTGWVVGDDGKILHTTNGGINFSENIFQQFNTNSVLLYSNYPNPFNSVTKIRYIVHKDSYVQIKIFDILGNEIETLVNEEKFPGEYEYIWNPQIISSGIYILQIKTESFIQGKKMVYLK